MHNWKRRLAAAALGVVALAGSQATAGVVTTFMGQDPGAGPTAARPNSDATAASFAAAAAGLGVNNVITFENLPVGVTSGTVGPLTLAPGVTYNSTNSSGGIASSSSVSTGYNTTAGGSKFLQYTANTATNSPGTFSFANPIDAFGAYFTGVGTVGSAAVVSFNDGTSQSFTLFDQNNGGVQFFGITDVGGLISSIVLQGSTSDVLGIDDLRYAVATPEPSTLVGATTAALFGLGVTWRKRRRSA